MFQIFEQDAFDRSEVFKNWGEPYEAQRKPLQMLLLKKLQQRLGKRCRQKISKIFLAKLFIAKIARTANRAQNVVTKYLHVVFKCKKTN